MLMETFSGFSPRLPQEPPKRSWKHDFFQEALKENILKKGGHPKMGFRCALSLKKSIFSAVSKATPQGKRCLDGTAEKYHFQMFGFKTEGFVEFSDRKHVSKELCCRRVASRGFQTIVGDSRTSKGFNMANQRSKEGYAPARHDCIFTS